MSNQQQIGRRSFLVTSATGLAAVTALAGGSGQNPRPAASAGGARREGKSPNERLSLAVIGTGGLGRGGHHLGRMINDQWWRERVDVLAVCDVDRERADGAAQDCMNALGRRVDVYGDFRRVCDRKDIDAVLIATPDHWHALVGIAAMESGKDVYCEKPLTLTIEEGRRMVETARRYGAVFQTGSQQRSDGTFRKACEIVRAGMIGKVKRVDTVLHGVGNTNWQAPETPPSHMDWNFWLGPAPYAEYRPNCVHYQFRWQYDYSGGVMTDWGAHHNDICQWGLGTDDTGPVYVDGTRARWHQSGPYTVPSNFDVHYKYADGTELWCHTDDQSYDDGTRFGNGVKFTGEKGWVFVARGGAMESSLPNPKEIEVPSEHRLCESQDHHKNWYECLFTRNRPICDVEIGHRSVSICHIGNISMRLGRPLKWDPDAEQFINDEVANRFVSKPMRAPWHL